MQFNNNDILLMIKKAALDVVNASKPVEILYGTVEVASPLAIRVNQNTLLQEIDLVLTRNVSNYSIQFSESTLGTSTLYLQNSLVQGEKVVLIKFQGGQDYLVLDRVV